MAKEVSRAPRQVNGFEVHVECGNEQHRILLTDKGRLKLCAHPNGFWKTLQMQEAIGMPLCTCAQVLKAWRTHHYRALHRIAPRLADVCASETQKRRRRQRDARITDRLTCALDIRVAVQIQQHAYNAFRACRYRQPPKKADFRIILGVVPGVSHHQSHHNLPHHEVVWSIKLNRSWLYRVARQGLAVVGGRFVLRAQPYAPGVWRIDYIGQASGTNLARKPKHGFAVQNPDGSFVLRHAVHQFQDRLQAELLSRPCLDNFSVDNPTNSGITLDRVPREA